MGRIERPYTQILHWHCNRHPSGDTRRGCKDSECFQTTRKALTNRLRRNYSKRVIREETRAL